MSNDSKLGLVLGLGLVMVAAVTYYPRQAGQSKVQANVVPSLPSQAPATLPSGPR